MTFSKSGDQKEADASRIRGIQKLWCPLAFRMPVLIMPAL